jgi:hypothetical protein
MIGSVVKNDCVGGITQEGRPARHQGHDAIFALLPQVLLDAGELGHEADQGLGLMNVEVVTDKMPAGGLGIGGHDRLHMGQKILLRPRGSSVGSHDLSAHHISTEDEGTGAVAGIFKLASLHFSGSQRQSGVLTLQGLDPGEFIRADRSFALFGQLWSLSIDLTDRPDGFFFLRVRRRSQPVADQMRLESVFFNKRAACRGEICLTIPRAITSSAISCPVQWLMGRSLGCSQASAII